MQQVSELIGVLAWPVVVLVSVFLFRKALRDVLSRDDLSFTGPAGIAFSARRATGALVDAAESKAGGTEAESARPVSATDAADQVQEAGAFVRQLGRSPRLLWVDDKPSNNRYERTALENMGMTVDLSTSTVDAQQKLQGKGGGYDLVISDMARPEDPRAGYVLLDWMRKTNIGTPFVIYSSSDNPAHYDEAVARGAVGSTARPTELIDMILRALRSAPPRARWWRR